MRYHIGHIVKLLKPCLENKEGTLGYVYDTYKDFDNCNKIGICVIFQNGQYCGFSYEEQKSYFIFEKFILLDYNFTNVMKLTQDFNNGYFNTVWQRS